MKRIGYLHEKICTYENIEYADNKARQHKTSRRCVKSHDKRQEFENKALVYNLKNFKYKTSDYKTFKIYEPKERIIFRLPYYPDRIVHHAIMNVMEPIWVNIFISHTYSCIKNRGIHKLANDLKRDLRKNSEGTKYCLKLDIKKFYPSITHSILIDIIKKKVKDKNLIRQLTEIIESADGVPIGNYLSQFFANLYLTYFDHWVKEELKCKYYYRYADDIVVLSDDKNFLRTTFIAMKIYLKYVLKLQIKENYQIFPVNSRGIDFVGYKFYHTHTLLRKSIKLKINKLIAKYKIGKITAKEFYNSMQSYFGWLKYCDSKHFLNKIKLETGLDLSNWIGKWKLITQYSNKTITVFNIDSHKKYYKINFVRANKSLWFKSINLNLYKYLCTHSLPLTIKIKNYGKKYNKSKKSNKTRSDRKIK